MTSTIIKGKQLLDENEPLAAMEVFEQVLPGEEDYCLAVRGLAVAYYLLKQYDEAVQKNHEVIKLDPECISPYFNLGSIYQDLGNSIEAAKYYKNAVELGDNNFNCFIRLGYVLEELGNNKEAIYYLKIAAEIDPTESASFIRLGYLYDKESQLASSEECFRQAIKLNPQDLDSWYCIARLLFYQNKDLYEAESILRSCIAVQEDKMGFYAMLGGIKLLQENYVEAEQIFLHAIQLEFEYENPFVYLGEVFTEKGYKNRAVDCYQLAIKIAPNDFSIYSKLAILVRDEDAGYAEACFRKSLELEVENNPDYKNLGILLAHNYRFEEALPFLLKAIQIKPDDVHLLGYLGYLYYDIFLMEEGKEVCLKGMSIEPDNIVLIRCYITILMSQDNIEAALPYSDKLLGMNDKEFIPYCVLGQKAMNDEDFELSVIYLETALKYVPADEEVPLFLLGKSYELQAKYEKAITCFIEATKINNKSGQVFLNMAQLPVEYNPDCITHLYRAIYLYSGCRYPRIISKILQTATDLDADMLIYNLISKVGADNNVWSFIYEAPLQRTIEFRQLISIWQAMPYRDSHALLAEALVNYYLGDPVRAFFILSEGIEGKFKTSIQYLFYYAQSAVVIAHDDKKLILGRSLKKAEELIKNSSSDVDSYYLACLYIHCGILPKAISILEQIMPTFLQAGYKLASLYQFLNDQPKYDDLIIRINMEENMSPLYRFGLRSIAARHDPDEFISDILPIVLCLEVQDVVADIFLEPIALQDIFYKCIQISEDNPKRHVYSLKEAAANAWLHNVEKKVDERVINEYANTYSHHPNPHYLLGKDIEHGAKAELYDFESNNRNPAQFEFNLYLALNYRLYKSGHISAGIADAINAYLFVCMQEMPGRRNSSTISFLISSIFDNFLEDSIPYFGYIQNLQSIYEAVKADLVKNEGAIISFSRFYEIYTANQE